MVRPGPRSRRLGSGSTISPRQHSASLGSSPRSARRWSFRRGRRTPTSSSFATFLIVGPVCFILGILFSLLPYDYYVLWSVPTTFPPSEAFNALEQHLRFLNSSTPLISRMLNTVIGVGLLGLCIKLYKPKETNMLFDGASLVLYVVTLVVYLSNFIKGLGVISSGDYGFLDSHSAKMAGVGGRPGESKSAGGVGGPSVGAGARNSGDYISREDRLRAMAVFNTIMALLMVGILVLQAGQWYAAREEEDELEQMDRGTFPSKIDEKSPSESEH